MPFGPGSSQDLADDLWSFGVHDATVTSEDEVTFTLPDNMSATLAVEMMAYVAEAYDHFWLPPEDLYQAELSDKIRFVRRI